MPSARSTALAVGVTGGIGSGKSTFCRLLRTRPGVAAIDADRVVRGLLACSPGVGREVGARFGPGVLTRAGRVDRRRLGQRVFADPRALRRLEALLHPIVLARLARRVAALKRRPGVAIVLVEIPLLAEVGRPDWCDVVVTVEAGRRQRLERLAARGLEPDRARQRMARQAGDARRRRMADYVIRNDRGLVQLERAAGELWRRLAQRLRRPELLRPARVRRPGAGKERKRQ